MTSNAFTNEPKRPTPNFGSPTVEYVLHLEDHLALDMFMYDKVRAEKRRTPRFWAKRFLSLTSILAAYAYVLGLGMSIEEPWQSLMSLAVLGFSIVCLLDTFWPRGLFSGFFRSVYQGRMTRLIRTVQHAGPFNPKWRRRVVMTEHFFIESNDFWEDTPNLGVEITEHKETRVEWRAVSSIDVTVTHAFCNVTEKGYLILPCAAFADEASFMDFVDTARSYRKAAGAMPAPRPELSTPSDTRITR
jgi:hypothetical protein